jgi:hypothetical protein
MVVHDFAYADLGFDGYKPPSILQVEGAKEVAVEIFSMSKSYNMAGWRVGYCLGNPRMIAALARIKSYLDYGVFPADTDRVHHRAARVRGGHAQDLRRLPEAPRCAGERSRARRLARGEAARNHVPVGAAARALSRGRLPGVRQAAHGESAGGRLSRGSASAPWARGTCASRWWKTSIASGRRHAVHEWVQLVCVRLAE